jgi:hypothetical protein
VNTMGSDLFFFPLVTGGTARTGTSAERSTRFAGR